MATVGIWGEPSTYTSTHDSSLRTEEYKKYCFMYGNLDESYGNANNTLACAIRTGKLELYSMDLSPSYCGADAGFCMNNGKFIHCYYNTERKDWSTSPKNATPLMFHWQVATGPASWECRMEEPDTNTFNRYFYTPFGNFSTPSSVTSLDYRNTNVGFKPFLQVPVQGVVFLTAVCCNDVAPPITENISGFDSSRWYDLDCYCNGKTSDGTPIHTKYPYVKGIALFPFCYRSATNVDDNKRGGSDGLFLQHWGNYITDEIKHNNVPYTDINCMCQCEVSPERNMYNIMTSDPDGVETQTKLFSTVYSKGIFIWGRETYSVAQSRTGGWYHYLAGSGDTRLLVAEPDWQTSKNKYIYQYTRTSDFGDIQNFYNFFMSQSAYLGLFFTPKLETAYTGALNDDNMYLGIIDSSGITHGTYSKGKDNEKQPQYLWEDAISQSPYDPTKKPEASDTEDKSDAYKYNNYSSVALDSGNYYAMTSEGVKKLIAWCEKITNPKGPFAYPGDKPSEGQFSLEQLGYDLQFNFNGSYPADQIMSLMYFPFNINTHMGFGTILRPAQHIQLANAVTEARTNWYGSDVEAATGTQLTGGNQFAIFETSAYAITRRFDDFRDFEPYTTMSIVIPWHGTIPINPGEWYDHNLTTRMVVDIITGASTTFIERDGIPMETLSGQVGVPIQLVIRNAGDYVNTLLSGSQALNQQKADTIKNVVGLATSATAAVVGGATGNAAMAGVGLAGVVNSTAGLVVSEKQYQNTQRTIAHTKAGTSAVSCNAPSVAMQMDTQPKLITTYPRLIGNYNAATYGSTVGFACAIQGDISSFAGFTVFSGADLDGINASDTEKLMIYNKLKDGIIIK